jgi:hypothetical protein
VSASDCSAFGAAFFVPAVDLVLRAASASAVTVFSWTSSMTAIGALSPLRGSVFVIRV